MYAYDKFEITYEESKTGAITHKYVESYQDALEIVEWIIICKNDIYRFISLNAL